MSAIRSILPHESIVYFGDTARQPYGNKNAETILRYSIENAQFLLKQNIKLLIIACHTACACAFEELAQTLPIPLVGVIMPAVDELLRCPQKTHVAVIGTRATIASGVYQAKIHQLLPDTEISALACPLFVPLVEEGFIDHPLAEMVVQEYLGPLRKQNIDTLLLACTHYPLLQTVMTKELGNDVVLINPGITCAKEVQRVLEEHDLLNLQANTPRDYFFVSDDTDKFRRLGQTFLTHPIECVRLWNRPLA